jgi:hypothetical protein
MFLNRLFVNLSELYIKLPTTIFFLDNRFATVYALSVLRRKVLTMKIDDSTLNWLLEDENPSIKYLTLTELLDEPIDSAQVKKAKAAIAKSPMILSLLSDQKSDGGFGCNVYDKWMGAHWRLRAMVDLAIPEGDKRALKSADQVLKWLLSPEHKKNIRLINGRIRRCASQEGNALLSCCRLGIADDQRVKYLAQSLVSWQWPDGGWNCDKEPDAHHSSFYESIIPMWGLLEYHQATGDKNSLAAAKKTGEFLLRHKLFRSERTGKIITHKFLNIRYPHYWHYNILQGLSALAILGNIKDPRASEALDIVEQKRHTDGRWKADGYYWKTPAKGRRYGSPVDWWRGKPNKMLTLNALKVLKKAGRLK